MRTATVATLAAALALCGCLKNPTSPNPQRNGLEPQAASLTPSRLDAPPLLDHLRVSVSGGVVRLAVHTAGGPAAFQVFYNVAPGGIYRQGWDRIVTQLGGAWELRGTLDTLNPDYLPAGGWGPVFAPALVVAGPHTLSVEVPVSALGAASGDLEVVAYASASSAAPDARLDAPFGTPALVAAR